MKTLIISGSPRVDGDCAAMIGRLKKCLVGEVAEIWAYGTGAAPCADCRRCWERQGCAVADDMRVIYDDDFDNVFIASPVHFGGLSGPLISLAGRFQAYYAAKKFLREPIALRPKRGAIFLAGGGDGRYDEALRMGRIMLKFMNARLEGIVISGNTNEVAAERDLEAVKGICEIGERFCRGV